VSSTECEGCPYTLRMSNLFAGKVGVVTGASSGIGRATAAALGHAGAAVVLVGRDEAALAELRGEMESAGARAVVVAADVTATDTPSRVIAAAGTLGGLDVLVNAAGIIAGAATEATDDALWDRMMDINVRAPFRLMREALPLLVVRQGAVVNVSSVTGLRAFPGLAAYCASKAAVDQLTRCAALDWAPHGVRVNAVNPGVVVTNLHRRGGMDEDKYAAFLERSRETHPLGRPGTVDEIADLILFLASSRAAWITGETISIDGGRHLTCAR
jgi:NAD(P)-dependent dehydrogenase (short-subunit alcohol dehydrogenase family)